jgi:histidinol-phosphate/aromatic aminotransferase/cobyric acid decarboxylase-like protein
MEHIREFTDAERDVLFSVAKDKPLPMVKSERGNFMVLKPEHDEAFQKLKKEGYIKVIIGTSFHDLTNKGYDACKKLNIIEW